MTLRLIINIGLTLSLCATVQAQEVPPAVIAKIRAPIEAKYPEGLYEFGVGALRWRIRVDTYMLLMVDEYPPFP